jgi:hypothetical protein
MRSFTGKPASAAPFVATLTILDNEKLPLVQLLDPVVTVTEGLDAKVVFRLFSTTQAFGIRVHYKTVDLTAFDVLDYDGATGFVDMQVIVDGGTEGVIEIPIKNDVLLEAPRASVWSSQGSSTPSSRITRARSSFVTTKRTPSPGTSSSTATVTDSSTSTNAGSKAWWLSPPTRTIPSSTSTSRTTMAGMMSIRLMAMSRCGHRIEPH